MTAADLKIGFMIERGGKMTKNCIVLHLIYR